MTTAAKTASAPAPAYRGQRVGYLRVSTLDQTTARQLDGLDLDQTFEDKVSGATTDRPQLQAALKHCRKGDTLVVHSMDRLARNLGDLKAIIDGLTKRGVTVEFIKERQTFRPEQDDPMATLMLHLLGAVAQFERDLIKERQREGIELAKARGVYKGRAPKLPPERVAELKAKDKAAGGKGRAGLAREFSISRETLYQYLKGESGVYAIRAVDGTSEKSLGQVSIQEVMRRYDIKTNLQPEEAKKLRQLTLDLQAGKPVGTVDPVLVAKGRSSGFLSRTDLGRLDIQQAQDTMARLKAPVQLDLGKPANGPTLLPSRGPVKVDQKLAVQG